MTNHPDIVAAFQQFENCVAQRDMMVAQLFSHEGRIAGSEVSDLAVGREAIAAHFKSYFTLPFTIHWDWHQQDVSFAGDVAWLFADGDLVLRGDDGEKRSPYRLTCIFVRQNGQWLIAHFHGAQPIPDR